MTERHPRPAAGDVMPALGPDPEFMKSVTFDTLAIHAGVDPDPTTGAIVPPIYAVSTYAQDSVANPRQGFVYSRPANPTRRSFEACMAALEGGSAALAFASGMAAIDAVFRVVCKPGDHIVIPHDVYGGTFRLIDKVLTRWGISYTAAPMADAGEVRDAIRPGQTVMIWCETPSNPMLTIADIRALADLAEGAGVTLAVDNTFASPCLQRPLDFGARIVIHSTTKYLGGHSDLLGGAVVVNDEKLAESLHLHQNSMGAVPSPFDVWLTLRGIKTLSVRMQRQCATAAEVAAFLQSHPAVDHVFYPGLPTHPGHDIAAKQMNDYGGIVSFTARGGEPAALHACNNTRLFSLAESLGAVESIITHPLRMTHASAKGSAVAPPADLVRLSIGLEAPGDLIHDLQETLDSFPGRQ